LKFNYIENNKNQESENNFSERAKNNFGTPINFLFLSKYELKVNPQTFFLVLTFFSCLHKNYKDF